MDIKDKINDVVKELTSNKDLLEQFKKIHLRRCFRKAAVTEYHTNRIHGGDSVNDRFGHCAI